MTPKNQRRERETDRERDRGRERERDSDKQRPVIDLADSLSRPADTQAATTTITTTMMTMIEGASTEMHEWSRTPADGPEPTAASRMDTASRGGRLSALIDDNGTSGDGNLCVCNLNARGHGERSDDVGDILVLWFANHFIIW